MSTSCNVSSAKIGTKKEGKNELEILTGPLLWSLIPIQIHNTTIHSYHSIISLQYDSSISKEDRTTSIVSKDQPTVLYNLCEVTPSLEMLHFLLIHPHLFFPNVNHMIRYSTL